MILPLVFYSILCVGLDESNGFENEESSGPFCGLYCASVAAKYYNIKSDVRSLISDDYLSGPEGSSAQDLTRALESIGLKGSFFHSLSLSNLLINSGPVILLTKSPGSPKYNHWVLFLGFENGEIVIYDPPRTIGKISHKELLSIWNGKGIIVSPYNLIYSSLLPSLEIVALIFLTILLFKAIAKTCNPLVKVSLVFGIIFIVGNLFPSGLLGDWQALNNVSSLFFNKSICEFKPSEIKSISSQTKVVFIDARIRSSFKDDHINEAINIPISSGYLDINAAANSLDPSVFYVVYCQNDNCRWAHSVWSQLLQRRKLEGGVLKGGFNAWKSNHEQ